MTVAPLVSCDLVRHKGIHTREKPYNCDICYYSTTRSNLLAEHQARHAGEKSYKRDVCSYRTARKGDLVRHKGINTGEKPYKCDVCSYCTVFSAPALSAEELLLYPRRQRPRRRPQNVRANVKVLEFKSFYIFSCILSLLIILTKPLTTKAYDRRASGDCGTSGLL